MYLCLFSILLSQLTFYSANLYYLSFSSFSPVLNFICLHPINISIHPSPSPPLPSPFSPSLPYYLHSGQPACVESDGQTLVCTHRHTNQASRLLGFSPTLPWKWQLRLYACPPIGQVLLASPKLIWTPSQDHLHHTIIYSHSKNN